MIKNKFIFLSIFTALFFAVVGITRITNLYKTSVITSVDAQSPSNYPYPTSTLSRSYVYITFTCNNDPRNLSYVSQFSSVCKGSSQLLQEANNSCNNRFGSRVATYSFSPACAAPRITPTGYQLTPTPITTKPDLTIGAITRDALYYRVLYCNSGGVNSTTFTVSLKNPNTGISYTTGALRLPPANSCTWTAGISCSLLRSNCTDNFNVEGFVDSANTIAESNENNNIFRKSFGTVTPTPTRTPTGIRCVAYIPSDYNQDGVVNVFDYVIWLNLNPGITVCPTPQP